MAAANVITISAFQIPDCQFGAVGQAAYLDIYYDSDWVDNLGIFHPFTPVRLAGLFNQRVTCSITTDLVTGNPAVSVPSFNTFVTVNAQVNSGVHATGIIRDQNFVYKLTLFDGFFLPAQATIDFASLKVLNQGKALFLPVDTYLSAVQIQTLIANQAGLVITYTVGTLPSAAANVGRIAYVTDGDVGLAWGAMVSNSGAGATKYLVWSNGSQWTVIGK